MVLVTKPIIVRVLDELKFSVNQKTVNRNFRFGYSSEFYRRTG